MCLYDQLQVLSERVDGSLRHLACWGSHSLQHKQSERPSFAHCVVVVKFALEQISRCARLSTCCVMRSGEVGLKVLTPKH
jgi:hypothetical protein